jgi:hypothetical protein
MSQAVRAVVVRLGGEGVHVRIKQTYFPGITSSLSLQGDCWKIQDERREGPSCLLSGILRLQE